MYFQIRNVIRCNMKSPSLNRLQINSVVAVFPVSSHGSMVGYIRLFQILFSFCCYCTCYGKTNKNVLFEHNMKDSFLFLNTTGETGDLSRLSVTNPIHHFYPTSSPSEKTIMSISHSVSGSRATCSFQNIFFVPGKK